MIHGQRLDVKRLKSFFANISVQKCRYKKYNLC